MSRIVTVLFRSALAVIGLFVLVSGHDALAQERELQIVSNADSAGVYVDGAWQGIIADGPFAIPVKASEVVVRPPGDGIWSIDPLRYVLSEYSGSEVTIEADFDHYYRIDSMPSGASVYGGDTLLGQTPLVYRTERSLEDVVRLELQDYREALLKPGARLWNHLSVELEPSRLAPEAVRSDHVVDDKGPNWLNIAVTASAFAAGALAVHYRTKADNRFEDYGVTGKESLRSDIRRLDVQSGVALGAMQAGLGFVAIRLAF